LSGATTQFEELQQAEGTFSEPSGSGISTRLSAFWRAWSSLAEAPTSEAAKEGVVSAGAELTTALHQLSSQISTVSTQATQ
jgi:flagellar hook-associated protein FlgK